jgi:hypothetical protein
VNRFLVPLIVTIVGGVIAAAMVAALHIGGTSGGGGSSGGGGGGGGGGGYSPAAGSTSPAADPGTSNSVSPKACVFLYPYQTCTSSNGKVYVDENNTSSTAGCTFNFQIDWGDGLYSSVPITGGSTPGTFTLADHFYKYSGTYTITESASVTSGSCTLSATSSSFTAHLVSPGG